MGVLSIYRPILNSSSVGKWKLYKTINETVILWKLFLLGFPDPQAQTGSNETPSFRQTKYCQTERHLYEIVSVKKTQILLTSNYIFPLSHSKNINLPETRHNYFYKYRSHHQHFVLTTGYFNWKIYDQKYYRNQEPDITGLYIGSI